MRIIRLVRRSRYYLLATALVVVGLYTYNTFFSGDSGATATFYAVTKAETGNVSSGIETTGTIMAAEKLDLDVYKQLSRIDVVNAENGGHVAEGDVIVSFDKSDAYVDSAAASVSVTEAALNLKTEQDNQTDPNTEIRNLENKIASYQNTINNTEQDLKEAYYDFLNTNLEVMPDKSQISRLSKSTIPTLSGRYVSEMTGTYYIRIYSSNAESGFSYTVSGLESATQSLVLGKTNNIGTRGLKITFPNDVKTGDIWVIKIPNDTVATYSESKADYEQKVTAIKQTSKDAEVALENAKVELENAKATDGSDYRSLSVAKAVSSLSEARQRLAEAYDVVQERDIVAPFAGTIEGMENVVAGATPTGGTSDSISLGTLVSDEFLVTFSLSAADAAKVVIGQKVNLSVTSFPDAPSYTATITHISSLPEESGVAQYEVLALIDYNHATATKKLREGMLSDIEVVEEEKENVLRVPTTALSYEGGQAKVTVATDLTPEQISQIENMGIIKTSEAPLTTYTKDVSIGIRGQYYVEITSGLTIDDYIVTTSVSETASESVVEQSGPGPRRSENGNNNQPPAD